MVPQQQELICSLELECSRKFGNSKYSFYYPIQLENFLINCWKTQTQSDNAITTPSNSFLNSKSSATSFNSTGSSLSSSSSPSTTSDRFCCIIYENGSVVLPNIDSRMKNFSWAKTFSKRSDFSKEELETLLSDIYTQCCFR